MSRRGLLRYVGTGPNRRMAAGGQVFARSFSEERPAIAAASPRCQLDDLTLEGVKCQLSATERVFFEPLSRRFASIRAGKHRRLALYVADRGPHEACNWYLNYDYDEHDGFNLTIADQHEAVSVKQEKMSEERLKQLLVAIMSRIRRFHLIVAHASDQGRTATVMQALLHAAAATATQGPIPLRVHRFELKGFANIGHLSSKWIQQIASSVRHVRLGRPVDREGLLAAALGGCRKLRSLDISGVRGLDGLFSSVLGRSLPRLHTLRCVNEEFGRWPMSSTEHQLTISDQWLSEVDAANDNGQLLLATFLQRTTAIALYMRTPRIDAGDRAAVSFLVSSLNASSTAPSTVYVVVKAETFAWQPALIDWLRMASGHRVVITIESSCPLPSSIVAIESAVQQANIAGLIPPKYNPNVQVFRFRSGGEVRLEVCDMPDDEMGAGGIFHED